MSGVTGGSTNLKRTTAPSVATTIAAASRVVHRTRMRSELSRPGRS